METNNDCGFLIKQICDRLQASANMELKDSGLTFSQVRYMEYLCRNHPRKIPMKELEAAFNVSQPTVAGIVSRLEKKELIRTEQSTEDSRAKTVCVTEGGYAEFMHAKDSRDENEQRLLSPLSGAEQKQLRGMLSRILENL